MDKKDKTEVWLGLYIFRWLTLFLFFCKKRQEKEIHTLKNKKEGTFRPESFWREREMGYYMQNKSLKLSLIFLG